MLGVDAARDAAEIRRRLGYMPELDCLPLEMTARDLVVHMAELRGLPRRDAVLRASEVLFQVGLEEERSRLIRTFSTGMKQRAKLAQALVHSPELVVLDEPTNGLDPSGREEMLALVRRLSDELGIAVLLSSHVLEDVTRTCDAVVVLREGRVVTAGRIDEMEGLAADGVLVRATGDLDAFVGRLAARGLAAQPRDGGIAVRGVAEDALLDGVRDAAAEAGVALRELRPPGPPWRTPSWRPWSERLGAPPRPRGRRGRDPRRPLRDVRGRAARARGGRVSLARWGALRSLGARRGWKAKAVPITLILLAIAPAVIVLGVRALFADQTGIDLTEALPFSGYQAIIGVVILLFAGITTPELLCPDRRDGVLQLYFSTAVSRGEYLAGRVIGAIAPLLLVTMVPMLVLYAGILVFEEHPVGYLEDNWAELPRIVAAGVILAVYYGLVGLAVSSLTGRRAFAIGGYLLLLVAPTACSAPCCRRPSTAPRSSTWSSSRPCRSASPARSSRTRDDIPNSLGSSPSPTWWWSAPPSVVLLRRYRPGSEA